MNDKFGFLILHYISDYATISCVESIIENIDTNNYIIVIVDNASPNDSVKKIRDKLKGNRKIKIIENKKNLGFAKGNNVGFLYLKEVEKCDFICMMNNDTLLKQKDFFENIFLIYRQYECAVIGPKIILKDGNIQPPLGKFRNRRYYRKILFLAFVDYAKTLFRIKKIFQKNLKFESSKNTEVIKEDTEQKNILLHGCCLVFTPIYIKKFSGINDRTFLYVEEELLFLRLQLSGMINIYSPRVQIFHMEDIATDMTLSSEREKSLFKNKYRIKSLLILLDEMKKAGVN